MATLNQPFFNERLPQVYQKASKMTTTDRQTTPVRYFRARTTWRSGQGEGRYIVVPMALWIRAVGIFRVNGEGECTTRNP